MKTAEVFALFDKLGVPYRLNVQYEEADTWEFALGDGTPRFCTFDDFKGTATISAWNIQTEDYLRRAFKKRTRLMSYGETEVGILRTLDIPGQKFIFAVMAWDGWGIFQEPYPSPLENLPAFRLTDDGERLANQLFQTVCYDEVSLVRKILYDWLEEYHPAEMETYRKLLAPEGV